MGPATVIEATDTNVKIKCTNNKVKLLNVSHVKHFVLEKSALKAGVYPEKEDFGPPIDTSKPPPSFDYLSDSQNRPQTHYLTRLLHEQHSINFVQVDLHTKLYHL